MPALTVYGRFWHLASDDVPLFAAFGAIFHFAWVIAICVSGKDILTLPLHCHHSGKQYIAFYSGMLLVFFLGLLLEVLLIYDGFQGAVFQISKRRRMPFYLTLRFFNLISELVFTAYGTYVVFGTRLRCRISDTVILDPKRETMILIILTWSFELLTVLNAALWYNFWPDNDAAERWENRFAWIGRYVCCHFRPYTNEKEKDNRAYQQSLRKIARWVHKILGKLDLTPSDSALALVLVNALQRMARREKIVKSLSSADERYGLNAVSLMQRANTIGTLPMKNAGSVNIPIAISSSRMSEADVVEVSPPEGGSPVKVKTELLAGLLDEGMSDSQAEEQVNLFEKAIKKTISENKGALDDQEVKRLSLELESSVAIKRQAENFVRSVSKALTVPSSCSKSEEGEDEILKPLIGQERTNQHEDGVTSTSGSWPLENFKRQMRTLQRSCLTPSGMDQNLRGFRTSEEAVQIYTGSHWKVPAGLLQEVSYFARYAVGVYGFDAEVLKPRQKLWHWLCKCCMKIKEKTDPDEQQRTKMKMLYDDLFTGARQEMENMSELLYVSVENQALSHLPYIIALDHRSKSVVVAIRGTWSMEDIITDSVASAECLKDWLPPEFRKEHGEESEQMWAHSGVRGVADGILMDLEANGILSTLLGDKTGDLSNPEHQAASRVANGGKTSSTSKAREAAGHFIAGLMNRKLDLSGWKLVITGHSLGGGAAALIALKLCGRFKGLRCWSFCPPGGLMSKNLSRAVEPFVTSIAVGKDVVPRLSVVNIGRLIDQMVCALALCKHNKNAMLLKKMTSVWRHERASELFWDYDEVPQEALDVLQEYADIIKARSTMIELIPPGQVILLRALKVNGERNHWDAIWVKAEELIREGILISPSMANDHYALTLQAALSGAQGFVDEESVFPIYCPPRLDEEDPVPTSSLAS